MLLAQYSAIESTSDSRSLPARGGVYLLADADDKPILLASAQNLRRAVTHRLTEPPADEKTKRAALHEIVRHIRWTPTFSRFETDLRYWLIARELYPGDYRDRLAFGPAHFLRADPGERTPRFRPVTRYDDAGARYFGPFPTRRDADQYVQMLEDLFDLCRYHHVLEQAPHGQACAYFEMRRCPAPCDGTVSLESYRDTFRRAMAFAAGEHEPRLGEVEGAMRTAAGQLAFERAASFRTTLERARAAIAHESTRFVGDLERFRWLVLQPGGPRTRSRRRMTVKPFFVDGRRLAEADAVPLDAVPRMLPTWREFLCGAGTDLPIAVCADEVVWLVARYVYQSAGGRGLFLHEAELSQEEDCLRRISAHFDPPTAATYA